MASTCGSLTALAQQLQHGIEIPRTAGESAHRPCASAPSPSAPPPARRRQAGPCREGENSRAGSSTRSINCIWRTRFDRAFDAKQRLLRQPVLLQQQIGQDCREARGPYLQTHGLPVVRAVVQTLCKAMRRLITSSSSTAESELRVTRNWKTPSPPGPETIGQMRPHDAGDADEQPLFARNFLRAWESGAARRAAPSQWPLHWHGQRHPHHRGAR